MWLETFMYRLLTQPGLAVAADNGVRPGERRPKVFFRNLQGSVGQGRVQVLDCETSPGDNLLPKVNPTKTKSASAIVKYPALPRDGDFRLVVC